MDVFKYLKKTDTLMEASASEEAHKLGLVYGGYGKWKDPKTGQTTHKSVKQDGQTVLQKLDQSEAPEQETQKAEPQQKTLSQFRKDVPAPQPEAPVSDQMNRNVPGGPTADSLAAGDKAEVIKQLSRGRENVQSAARKAQIARQADQMIADDEAEREAAEAEAAAAAEAEAQEIQTSPDIITLDQAVREAEVEDETQGALDSLLDEVRGMEDEDEGPVDNISDASEVMEKAEEAGLSDRQKVINEFKEKLRESFEKEDAIVDSSMAEIRNSIQEIMKNQVAESDMSEEDMRDQFISVMALANTYSGRIRHGEGKRTMFYEDAQQLLNPDVQKMLLDGYGDGSPEQIEKFVNSRKIVDTPMEQVEALWKIIPDSFKGALGSGNIGTSFKALQPDGSIKNIPAAKLHYGGEGDKNRTTNSSTARKKLLLKLYLDQGGRDGYTGNELDPRYMELEHVRGINAMAPGEKGVTLDQLKERENLKNWLWIATGVNNEKSDLHMDKFLDNVKNKHGGKTKDQYVDLEAADKAFQAKNKGLASLLDNVIKNKQFTSSASPEAIQTLFDNELAESEAMDRNGIKKTPVALGDKMRKALGMVKDRKLTRSQIKTQKELFRPLIMNMIGQDAGKRKEMIENYNSLFHEAGDRTTALSQMGPDAEAEEDAVFTKGKLNEKGTWEKMFYKSLATNGLIDEKLIDQNMQPKEAAKFKKLIFENYYDEGEWIQEETITLTKPSGRDRIERLKRSLRDPIT
jgi:hypothetical protein